MVTTSVEAPRVVRKPMQIKPAIPLPHLKRQAAAAAARQRAITPATETKSSDAAKSDLGSSSPASPATTTTKVNVESPKDHGNPSPPPTASTDGHTVAENANDETSTPDATQPSNASPTTGVEKTKTQPEVNGHKHQERNQALNGHVEEFTPRPASSIANENIHAQPPAGDGMSAPVAHHMPAHADGPPGSQLTPNGPVFTHRPHPSLQFGALRDTRDPSPDPLSAGLVPPQGMPLHGGRPPFVPPASGGFAHGGPPPPGFPVHPGNEMGAYGGPSMPFPPAESYYPGGAFPPTPHSYHDSQSSSIPEDPGPYARFAHAGPRQPPGFGADTQGRGPAFPGTQPSPTPMMRPDSNARGLADHVSRHFGDPTFSDCTLEVVFHSEPEDKPKKSIIHGHRLVFSRSSFLYEAMLQQKNQSLPQSLVYYPGKTFIEPDSFHQAIQSLYGYPLLEMPQLAENCTAFGTPRQQFRYAISYACAGEALKWGPVVYRGCELAARLVNVQTFETAFEFALADYEDKGSYENFRFYEGSRIMLSSVVDFMLRELPRDLVLDTTMANRPVFVRLPHDTPSPSKPAAEDSSSPVVVKGHRASGSMSQSRQIQFGDLNIANDGDDAAQATPKLDQATASLHATFSCVLINMPFGFLKMFLEAVPGHHNAWASGETRYRVVQSVVAEREARRLRALDAVVAGSVPDSIPIQAVLRSPEPSHSAPWNILGWKEEITFPNSASGPNLTRQWAPIQDERRISVAAYP